MITKEMKMIGKRYGIPISVMREYEQWGLRCKPTKRTALEENNGTEKRTASQEKASEIIGKKTANKKSEQTEWKRTSIQSATQTTAQTTAQTATQTTAQTTAQTAAQTTAAKTTIQSAAVEKENPPEVTMTDTVPASEEVAGNAYDDADLTSMGVMMTLYEVGFSKTEVQTYMRLRMQGMQTSETRLRLLNTRRSAMLQAIHDLEKQLAHIDVLRYSITDPASDRFTETLTDGKHKP